MINNNILDVVVLNDYDYCANCNKLCDYLDLKPRNLRWYCKKCYKETAEDYPVVITLNLFELNDYDPCSKCGKIFDYLDLKAHNLKWYCNECYMEITRIDAAAVAVKQIK